MMKQPQLDENAQWKQRFRLPLILWSQIARHAPQRGLVACNVTGAYQLWSWDVTTDELMQLTESPVGKMAGLLSPDGDWVYYHLDQDGSEIGHYVRVPVTGGSPQKLLPGYAPYAPLGLTVNLMGSRLAIVVADADGFHLDLLDLEEGSRLSPPRRLYTATTMIHGAVLTADGALAVVTVGQREVTLHTALVALDTTTGELVGGLQDDGASIEAAIPSPRAGVETILATTNRTGAQRPLLWDPRTDGRADLPLAHMAGDVTPVDWSRDGERILLSQMAAASQTFYLFRPRPGTLARLNHPPGTYWASYFAPDGALFTQWQDSTHPPQLLQLDGQTGRPERVVLAAGETPQCIPWRSIAFRSPHGWMIQGWLVLPTGRGPFPTILHLHGGPAAVTTELFSPDSQAWLDHGVAYLSINYSGSTTFGREFEERIWGNPGRWELDDMAAAHLWLVENEIAPPNQVFVYGWSYGGYLALLALGRQPDLWAGAIAGHPVVDWFAQYEESPAAVRAYQVALLQGRPEERANVYAASSPSTYTENVEAPLLIFHGLNDTRVSGAAVTGYADGLRAAGKDVEVHAVGTGHLRLEGKRAVEQQETMLRFVYRVLESNEG